MKQKWKEKAACPYKLARVAYLSMPKAMCEPGIRGGKSVGGEKRENALGLWGAKCHLAYFLVLLTLLFFGGGTGVCALTAAIQDIPKE